MTAPSMTAPRGKFISLEGGEGAGKSTLLAGLRERFAARGIDLLLTREPGGTDLGEAVRSILLDPARRGMSAESELLLMFASRAQLVHQTIAPALADGQWVLCDRYVDASYAYQGGGRGLDPAFIAELERRVVGLQPGLTLLLDLGVDEGRARARGRDLFGVGDSAPGPDRIEREHDAFFQRVRAAFLARAAAEPARFRLLDATRPADAVAADAVAALREWQAAR